MDRKTYKVLMIVGLVGASLMLASFFLPQVRITILEQGYFASGFDLVQNKMIDDYRAGVGGNYFVGLPYQFPQFPMYWLLLLFGALSLGTPFPKDNLFRWLGILFGILGMAAAVYGYMRFSDAAATEPDWSVGIGYGLLVCVFGGGLIIFSNAVRYYLGNRGEETDTVQG